MPGLGSVATSINTLKVACARRQRSTPLTHRRHAPDGARQAVARALTSSTHASRYVRSRARLFHVARARLFARPEKSVVRQWHHLVLCRVDHSSQFVVMLMGHRAPKLSLWWLAVVGMRTVSAPSSGGGICSVRSERCVNRCLSRAYTAHGSSLSSLASGQV